MSKEMDSDGNWGRVNPECGALRVDYLRQVVKSLIAREDYRSAAFWADKLVCVSNGNTRDVYLQAQCLFHLKEYHRAAHCITSRALQSSDLACRHLTAKCHFAAKEYKEAFEVLSLNETSDPSKTMETETALSEEDKKWRSALLLLKGQIYEALDNRGIAVECFKEALKWDVYCFQAFHSLTQHQMLTLEEEEELLKFLKYDDQCQEENNCFVKYLYESLLKKYAKPGDPIIPSLCNESLANNVDILTAKAERFYYNCDYHQCFKITSEVLSKDLYHSQCLPIHLSCLMELKKTNALFGLAHKLVELYPESPISWYAVGCYYLMISKTDAARRFLNKATTLDSVFGPAWLLYGHSFAVESEHDQAMAAYFKASHLMKGCHLPLLYIGLEYGLTDNTKLAEKFFNQALLIAPDDPFVLHELGVVAYQNQDYPTAEKHFTGALNIIRFKKDVTHLPEKWEPLLNNMGHVLRKLKKYEEALEFHKQAMVLSPQNPSSYSAIGFVYSLMCNWNEAVEYFHKALGLKRDDPFSTSMLTHAIDHLINGITPLKDELPPYESSAYIDQFLSKTDDNTSEIEKFVSDELPLTASSPALLSNDPINESSHLDVEMDISTE